MGWELNVNARGQLLLDETEDDTTLTFNLQVGHGARFAPGQLRKLVIYEGNFFDSPADAVNRGKGECVRQTDQTGDTITVVRGLDGTTPIADFGDPEQKTWFIENFADAGTIGFNWISVLSFGAVGDGVTDASDAFDECFQAVPSGSTVYIPEGLYLLDAWPVNGRTYDKALRVRGEGAGSLLTRTVASPYTGAFLNISEEFSIEGVTFTHWLTPLVLDAVETSVPTVRISECSFTVCGAGVTWTTYDPGGNINLLSIRDCVFISLDNHAIRMIGQWDACSVISNYITNIGNGRGISLGNSTASLQGNWPSQDVANNVVRSINAGSLGIARGIEVHGEGATITGNEISSVTDGTNESIGIHIECKNSSISGNHIKTIEGSPRNAAIQVQGNDLSNNESGQPDGWSVEVVNNTLELFSNANGYGILAANDMMVVSGNVISNIGGIAISGDLGILDHSDMVISSNIISLTSTGRGIVIGTSGDRWHISDNTINGGTHGVSVGVAATVDDFSIIGNSFYNHSAIACNFAGAGAIAGVRIQTNHFVNTPLAVNLGTTANLITVAWNTYSAVTANINAGVATFLTRVEPGGAANQITYYNDIELASGNQLQLMGGAWNTAHLVIGSGAVDFHVWQDGTNLRGKKGAPTFAADGAIIV